MLLQILRRGDNPQVQVQDFAGHQRGIHLPPNPQRQVETFVNQVHHPIDQKDL